MIEEGNKKKEKSIAWEEGKDDEKTQAEEGREEETAKPTFSLISVLIFVSSSPKSLIGLILTPLFGLFIYNPFEFPNVEMCTNKFGDESMEKNMLSLSTCVSKKKKSPPQPLAAFSEHLEVTTMSFNFG